MSRWIAIFGAENKKVSVQMPKSKSPEGSLPDDTPVSELASLLVEVARLQAQLKNEQMRADAYDERALRVARKEFVFQYIREVRAKAHGIGGMKLSLMYRKAFGNNSPVGRVRFEDIVNRYGLKVRARVRKAKTTDSSHAFPEYPNICKDFIPTAPNQLWLSDIPYIPLWLNTYD